MRRRRRGDRLLPRVLRRGRRYLQGSDMRRGGDSHLLELRVPLRRCGRLQLVESGGGGRRGDNLKLRVMLRCRRDLERQEMPGRGGCGLLKMGLALGSSGCLLNQGVPGRRRGGLPLQILARGGSLGLSRQLLRRGFLLSECVLPGGHRGLAQLILLRGDARPLLLDLSLAVIFRNGRRRRRSADHQPEEQQ
jgi:hypothetical protein